MRGGGLWEASPARSTGVSHALCPLCSIHHHYRRSLGSNRPRRFENGGHRHSNHHRSKGPYGLQRLNLAYCWDCDQAKVYGQG